MLPRTLHISNPYHLSVRNEQLVLEPKNEGLREAQVPIEDIGYLVLEHPHITLTQAAIAVLSEHNVAVIFCSQEYLPVSMLFHLETHRIQAERFRLQVKASEPLSKQLWTQTIKAKLINQDSVLGYYNLPNGDLEGLAKQVKSGDTDNQEAQGARRYWPRMFGPAFTRERAGEQPNGLLNYGYTILRAAVARALCGSGLLPTLGIHHHNRYNHYALADDIMEPYRPFVDLHVKHLFDSGQYDVDKETKPELLKLLVRDVWISESQTNLSNALSITTASLAECFEGKATKIKYPNLKESLKIED
jgi:CRISPR-associated protein Cas1